MAPVTHSTDQIETTGILLKFKRFLKLNKSVNTLVK
jgi:hypothetical protein